MRPFGLVLLASGLALRQAGAQALDARWAPATPEQGGFAWVVLHVPGPAPRTVRAALDRVPIRFERSGDGLVALAAVRLDAPDSVRLALWLEDTTGTVTARSAWLPVSRATLTTTRLSVDPRFSRRPDSALAARIREESRRAQAVAARAQDTPRLWDGPFLRPRAAPVTSRYGQGRLFNGELRSRHWGTDFDGATGDTVRVANRGVVELVDEFYYGGNVIYVNHGAGLVTAYMHLSAALVAPGDTVRRGQMIGRVGQTGRVTGPHLHWSVRFGPAPVNGLSLLALPPMPGAGRAAR